MYFHIATQLNKETNAIPGGEKTAFAWVPFSDLLGAVAVASRRYFLGSAVKHRSMLGCPSKHDIQLHPCFATSLRLAMVLPGLPPLPRSPTFSVGTAMRSCEAFS